MKVIKQLKKYIAQFGARRCASVKVGNFTYVALGVNEVLRTNDISGGNKIFGVEDIPTHVVEQFLLCYIRRFGW
jgi:hypothetical protein